MVKRQSCLIQDEPGAGTCFSYKMSLEEGLRMLGIDHQHGRWRETEPRADSGVFGSERGGMFSGPQSRGIVRLGPADLTAAGLRRAEAWGQRTGAAVPSEDDRLEPGAGDTADPRLPARRRSEGASLSAPSISATVHAHRYRTSGASGPSARNPQRSSYSKDSAAGTT